MSEPAASILDRVIADQRSSDSAYRPLVEAYFAFPDFDVERLARHCGMTAAEVIEQLARRGLPIRYRRVLMPPYGPGP